MAGGGYALAMIQRLRANKKMLRRKRLFKRDVVFLGTKKENYKAAQGKITEKKATPEQLRQIREKIIGRNKRIERRNFLIAFVLVAPLLYYIIQSSITIVIPKEMAMTTEGKIITEKEVKNFHFFVEDANRWLQQEHWHNAIFQYKKALVIFPEDFEVQQQLALAYSYHCNLKNKDCEEGVVFIDHLLLKHPNDLTLQNIKSEFPSK